MSAIITDPGAIEARSMEIIESELTVEIPPENKAVVKRVIHCTADFDYAVNLAFSDGAAKNLPAQSRNGKKGAPQPRRALRACSREHFGHSAASSTIWTLNGTVTPSPRSIFAS